MSRKTHSDVRVSFGRAVRKHRETKQLSQEALADLAGIHRTYIGDVERGVRNIALVNMTKIATALGVSLSKLIADAETDA